MNILFLINCMQGGGAERVMTMLAEHAANSGLRPTIILTGQRLSDMKGYGDSATIAYRSLVDETADSVIPMWYRPLLYCYRFIFALCKRIKKRPPARIVLSKYQFEKSAKIRTLKGMIRDAGKDAPLIAFLDDTILLTLLAVKKLPNRVVISERSDVTQHDKSLRSSACIRLLYKNAACIVCQTDEAAAYYAKRVPSLTREVIPNPISSKLPEAYCGARQKLIVNFCRLDPPKNLPLLIDAFALVAAKHPDYRLEIIGEPAVTIDPAIKSKLCAQIDALHLSERAKISPFRADVHTYARDCAMFVSSSDFEGLSNSMLEALALGIPTICTDCLGGGARMMIKDRINGLLTPRDDKRALADAMCELIENLELCDTLSTNARTLRNELAEETICSRWLSIISA